MFSRRTQRKSVTAPAVTSARTDGVESDEQNRMTDAKSTKAGKVMTLTAASPPRELSNDEILVRVDNASAGHLRALRTNMRVARSVLREMQKNKLLVLLAVMPVIPASVPLAFGLAYVSVRAKVALGIDPELHKMLGHDQKDENKSLDTGDFSLVKLQHAVQGQMKDGKLKLCQWRLRKALLVYAGNEVMTIGKQEVDRLRHSTSQLIAAMRQRAANDDRPPVTPDQKGEPVNQDERQSGPMESRQPDKRRLLPRLRGRRP